MSKFQIIQTKAEIPSSSDGWVDSKYFYGMARNVDENGQLITSCHQGHQYLLVSEKVRYFPILERVARVFLGFLILGCSLGLTVFSKSVRDLITKDKDKIRFGVLSEFSEEEPVGPITADKIASINILKNCEGRRASRPCYHEGEVYFTDGRKMKPKSLSGREIQALLRAFPDKIKILGEDHFTNHNYPHPLKGEKVLKYLRVS